jgi:N-glycosylase/DNA lyase
MNAAIAQEILLLRAGHAEQKENIQNRLEEFAAVPTTEYFYEMAYCILTPQSSARNAAAVVTVLKNSRFAAHPYDAESLLGSGDHYIRFHRTKARRLLRLATSWNVIEEALSTSRPPADLRYWLVDNIDGFGMKEATHFMRNIGKNAGLAILDRHILRNLVRLGVIPEVPSSLSKKKYLTIESAFSSFARSVGIPLDELDLYFWSRETGEILK